MESAQLAIASEIRSWIGTACTVASVCIAFWIARNASSKSADASATDDNTPTKKSPLLTALLYGIVGLIVIGSEVAHASRASEIVVALYACATLIVSADYLIVGSQPQRFRTFALVYFWANLAYMTAVFVIGKILMETLEKVGSQTK